MIQFLTQMATCHECLYLSICQFMFRIRSSWTPFSLVFYGMNLKKLNLVFFMLAPLYVSKLVNCVTLKRFVRIVNIPFIIVMDPTLY